MRKQVVVVLILLAAGAAAMAQNDRDAFRYAQYSPTGTARYTALAGSMGAFGSDFSCLSAGNPAGIGLFKRFEFTFTLASPLNQFSTVYNGEGRSNSSISFFNVNNLGVVFVGSDTTGWKNIQFATGLNNLARYGGNYFVSGYNEGNNPFGTTSFFDYVAARADRKNIDLLSDFEYDALRYGLIGEIGKNEYESRVDADFDQQFSKRTSGYLNEYVFSMGGNYEDKVFLGATLGIPFFRYEQKITYSESRNAYYDSLFFTDEFNARATGLNLKLGVIYQPFRYMRLGAAFHTPTFYPNVKEFYYLPAVDVWNVFADSIYKNMRDGNWERYSHNYQLRTPYHAMANVAFICRSIGFVNLDYEYVDYTVSNLQSDSYNFSSENKSINDYYKGTHTIRIGGELNLSPLVLRAGAAYSSNPYKGIEKDGSRYTVSCGIGFKKKTFFADFAYMYRFSEDKDVFYDHFSLNPYTTQSVNQVFALTIGWKLKM